MTEPCAILALPLAVSTDMRTGGIQHGSSMRLIQIDQELAIGQTARVFERVLRDLQPQAWRIGALITIRDGTGRDFRARVVALSPGHCEVVAFEAFGGSVESPVVIRLLQALPKKERFEWIIEKTTELGVSWIVPFESERSITLSERDLPQKKSHRWQDIAVKAARQCRRAVVPRVHPVITFAEALDRFRVNGINLILWEGKPCDDFRSALSLQNKSIRDVTLVVGPEGGFSPDEVETARRHGYTLTGLGRRILRTETAAMAAIAIVQYELGDLSGKGRSSFP